MTQVAQQVSAAEIQITGTVQGVGFRPHVYRLALSLKLNGWVINTTAGVTIRLEGPPDRITVFLQELQGSPPPLAHIESFAMRNVQPEGFSAFFIHESKHVPGVELSISPDVGMCSDCLREYKNSNDRRYGYEFANCVNCGPRFSITRNVPYDRKNTSMHSFKMCEECQAEYTDPVNRRFHAEPDACPECGPRVILTTPDGKCVEGDLRSLLKEGNILAIKGIGGYHLSCDAMSATAVRLMRERKRRETKPFALMCQDLETVRQHCELSAEEEKLLTSPARPIMLLKRKAASKLCDEIAPGLDTLGIMLPYTPLHYGLFDEDLSILVMTSANISGDPLILTEEEAYKELAGLADYFVIHKREIINRSDDSVIMLFQEREYFIRRSRGYVPQGIKLPASTVPVFAAGGDLKSVFAYGKGNKAVLSQYFGDLDNLKNFEAYRNGVCFFSDFLQIKPGVVVCDMHPDYVGAHYAEKYAEELGVPLIKVQHHKAHFASVMADNGLSEKVLGVVCDGTGYGDDGAIWGCEFFYGDYEEIRRVGSLLPFSQPRGEGVARNPLHMATILLYSLWEDEKKVLQIFPESADLLPFTKSQLVSKGLCINSTSCGRIFDAAAALCGFTSKTTYEGEAAMRMEAMANHARRNNNKAKPYRYSIEGDADISHLSWHFIGEMAEDRLQGTDKSLLALRFHLTISEAICTMVEKLATTYKTNKVVFSGGTFQNRFIINALAEKLSIKGKGIRPYFHRQVPANDGGLALGQIMLGKRCLS